MGFVRSWLAENPATRRPYLPAADASVAFEQTGVPVYQLDGVLTDVDLFRRLRARGQARGHDGIADLMAALRLVRGEPFSSLRERGWSWLLDGERLHETITISIVGTAHIVVTDAFEQGDLEQAREAADLACLAAPYDEIARLDLIEVARASGHHELAERMTDEDIVNRSDNDLPPIDLPERTRAILTHHRHKAGSDQ